MTKFRLVVPAADIRSDGRFECNIKTKAAQNTEVCWDKITLPTQNVMGSNQGPLVEKLVSSSLSCDFVAFLCSIYTLEIIICCTIKYRFKRINLKYKCSIFEHKRKDLE